MATQYENTSLTAPSLTELRKLSFGLSTVKGKRVTMSEALQFAVQAGFEKMTSANTETE